MDLLIIDDDAVDRKSAVRNLKASSLYINKIMEADTADLGLQLAKSHKFDIILLDYQLPPFNGVEVLRQLRATNNSSTAVVMLSHSNNEELALECIDAGAQDFLTKSEVSASRLKRAILLATERYQLESQVRNSYEQLRKLAEQDTLTGLSNRYFFDEALKSAIPHAKRDNTNLALLLIDLDKFKNINDTQGHAAGDQFLQEVAQRLQKPIRDGDMLCRLGGDEFAILVHGLTNTKLIRLLITRIFDSLAAPVLINGKEFPISASIGVATYPDCGLLGAELMKCADVAMYRAKANGRNQVQYYSKEFHEHILHRIRIETDLKKALSKDQFVLFFQPQVDSQSLKIVGVEVLIRWQHPELGLIPPDEFIPIAEESDFIHELGRWVIEASCKQFSLWKQNLPIPSLQLSVSSNISARQLRDAGLIEHLEKCMEQYQIPAKNIELELTETCLETSRSSLDILNQLAELNINLSVDDFGTGYSTFAHIHSHPFKILKIDKTFVQHIKDIEQALLLNAIVAFAHTLDLETVAEGVETEFQMKTCANLGIKRLQGYFFSKPLPAEEFERLWLT